MHRPGLSLLNAKVRDVHRKTKLTNSETDFQHQICLPGELGAVSAEEGGWLSEVQASL